MMEGRIGVTKQKADTALICVLIWNWGQEVIGLKLGAAAMTVCGFRQW